MAMATPNILVVEDDRETRALIARYLRTNSCNVTTATDGREMARAMTDHRVDLLILDVMLPGEDGLSLCRKVRAELQTPIIMLTARGEDVDRILGLEMGADDYLAKPFNPRELLARINAVLRRQAAAQTASATRGAVALTFLGWRIDFRRRELRNPDGRAGCDDQRRIRPAVDLVRAARPGAVARQPARPHARPQRRLVRTQHRRPGQPHPAQDRAQSAGRHHDQDGAFRRLYVHPHRGCGCVSDRRLIMKLLGFLNLKGISGQIAALVVASIVAIHLIITATFLIHRPDQVDPSIGHGHSQLAVAIQLLGAAPAAGRPQLFADIARAFPQLDIESLPPGYVPAANEPDGPNPRGLHRRLGSGYRVFSLTHEEDDRKVGIALPDGAMISARIPPDLRQRPFWSGPWVTTLLFAVISVTLLGLWAARALTAPLSAFAKAAESFSLNGAAAPLPERGPEEIRSVAKALNRMRERITTLIDDRTRMLAAISHDLRTPITRMRLRSEFIEDDAQRGRMLRDLDQMRSMLESVLSFLRNDRKLESMTLADIASTLQLVADQFADIGHRVVYDGPEHAMATVRPDDLYRSITNLVENAVRFGAEATIRLSISPDTVTIDVEDDGPGISDERKNVMLEPFVRGDDARNMDEAAGFGLGLSIARAIVLAHGGELSLNDRQPHGLIVRIELPVRQQGRQSAA